MQAAKQKMTMQKWITSSLSSMWAICDAIPVGCWRQCVRGWWACCRGFWWAAAHVIINRATPGNGQQHATWRWLAVTAILLAVRDRHEPIQDRTTVKSAQWCLDRSSITSSIKMYCYVLLEYMILLIRFITLRSWQTIMLLQVLEDYEAKCRYKMPPGGQTA